MASRSFGVSRIAKVQSRSFGPAAFVVVALAALVFFLVLFFAMRSSSSLVGTWTYSEELGAGGDFRLRYHFPGKEPAGHVLWQGRLEKPLAGTWSVEAV